MREVQAMWREEITAQIDPRGNGGSRGSCGGPEGGPDPVREWSGELVRESDA